jgi:hypothetical protein
MRTLFFAAASAAVLAGCATVEEDVESSDQDVGVADVQSCTSAGKQIVTTDSLNVRQCDPGTPVGTGCAKLATLPKGKVVRYLGETQGDWVKVAVDDTSEIAWPTDARPSLASVWAHSGYLECRAPGEPAAPVTGPVTFDVHFDQPNGRARLDAQEKDVPVTVTIAGVAYRGARMEMHGATSRAYPKKSYDLKFGKCVDGGSAQGCEKGKKPKIEAALYGGNGTKSVDSVVLNASWIDGTMIRNPVVYGVARDLGALAPRTGYATLAFDGQRFGYYEAIEPVGDDDFFDRRDIAWGGSLYKATQHRSWDPNGDPFLSTDNGAAFKVTDGPGSREELGGFFRAALDRSVGDVGNGLLDLEDYRVFHMVQSVALNKDTFTKNYYLYKTPNGPWRVVFWDCDTTFGQDWMDGGHTNPEEDWYFGGQMGEFANRFAGDGNVNYLGRFRRELKEGKLTEQALEARIDAAANAARGPISQEVASRGKSFDQELAWMKDAMRRRHRKLVEKIEGECRYRACP